MKNTTILIVDDDKDLLTAVQILLRPKVGKVLTERNPENLRAVLEREKVDVLLLDMNFKSALNTGNEGLFWLKEIKSRFPKIIIVMITAYGAIDLAVKSVKLGAADFIVKPWQNEQLINTLSKALKQKKTTGKRDSQTPIGRAPENPIIGKSAIMEDLQYKISKIAPTDANILILGENGTGKNLIADAVQQQSRRKNNAYIKVDVGSLTETLFESELFGYKKGAFTGAREDRKGRFEVADSGTLFLDEIGNISLRQQAKLLSVLQNREVMPLGSSDSIPIDIRLLSATNIPLAQLADESRFRKDLIYRLNTVEIKVPPLRERQDDIALLARYFLKKYTAKYHKEISGFDAASLQKLEAYHYPGNVRELQYSIERAAIMAEGDAIREKDILFSPIEQKNERTAFSPDTKNLETMERRAIAETLQKNRGNISKSARELGLTRAALYRRIEKYGL